MGRNLEEGRTRQGQPAQILLFLPYLAQAGAFDHSAYLPYSPARPEDAMPSLALTVSKEPA